VKTFKDKVAVVTVAAGGIGRALVQVLAAEGMKEKRFYIFTHDYHAAIETRMNNLLEEKNPEPSPPNPKLMEILASMTSGS